MLQILFLVGLVAFAKGEVFVDEKQAWKSFARSGKIEDYIKYAQLRQIVAGDGTSMAGEAYSATQNPGTYDKGADHRGERPPGYGVDS